jgi:hypothetical protein
MAAYTIAPIAYATVPPMINQIMSFIQIGKSTTGVFLPVLADPGPTATIYAECVNRFRAMKISGKEPVALD